MRYRYTEIFSIKGLALAPGGDERSLIVDSPIGLRAFLTSQPDSHAFEGDRRLAVVWLMHQGLFNAEPTTQEFKQRVAGAVRERQVARQEDFPNNPFLIVTGEGEAPFNATQERDAEDFIVCWDGADEIAIRAGFYDNVTAVLSSIVSAAASVIGIKKVGDAIVFFREDGKPVYSFTFQGGQAKAYVSTWLTDDQALTIEKLYRRLSADTTLQRVQRLLRSSFETDDDPLRSFLTAWSALEVFVDKAFGTYEALLFESMLEERHSGAHQRYLARIRQVMKGKHQLADKFAAISFQLSPTMADEDLKTVDRIKQIRDNLSHGGTVDEANLPVTPIRDLTSKYLRLHLERGIARKTE